MSHQTGTVTGGTENAGRGGKRVRNGREIITATVSPGHLYHTQMMLIHLLYLPGSDVVEVPLDVPVEKPKRRSSPDDVPKCPPPPRMKSPSPIPDGGLGDSLSIEETNKLRAKLGLKPLQVESQPAAKKPSGAEKDTSDISEDDTKITDDLGEFYHKPAVNITELKNAEKIREKIKERREKRKLEDALKKTKTLGESDSDDDVNNWVERNREKAHLKKQAEQRAKVLEEMDEEFSVSALAADRHHRSRKKPRDEYKYSSLKGLKVDHDVSEFSEGKTVILTLKDADVLDDEAKDTLVNVNIVDTERYRKNIENKKFKPGQTYGYECYDDDDEEGGSRSVLKKYDDEIGERKKSSFVIGATADPLEEQRRKMMEIKCKLENKRLVSLNEQLIRPASEYYTEEEMAVKFKKPKKKKGTKKLRTRVTADDLLALSGDVQDDPMGDLRTIKGRHGSEDDKWGIKREVDADNDDLERVLSKARRLKQKEAVINKAVAAVEIKEEVKQESGDEDGFDLMDTKIVLNETAEFCRTLGDIPTYGMAGNRESDLNDMMELEEAEAAAGVAGVDGVEDMDMEEGPSARGTWNSVEEEERETVHIDLTGGGGGGGREVTENKILDDEPDVGSGVAGALRLAMSKGYLEKEESNKPSNSRMAYLQAKNYSIDDKHK